MRTVQASERSPQCQPKRCSTKKKAEGKKEEKEAVQRLKPQKRSLARCSSAWSSGNGRSTYETSRCLSKGRSLVSSLLWTASKRESKGVNRGLVLQGRARAMARKREQREKGAYEGVFEAAPTLAPLSQSVLPCSSTKCRPLVRTISRRGRVCSNGVGGRLRRRDDSFSPRRFYPFGAQLPRKRPDDGAVCTCLCTLPASFSNPLLCTRPQPMHSCSVASQSGQELGRTEKAKIESLCMKFRYPPLTHRMASSDQTSTLISYVPSPSFSLSVSEPCCPAGPSSSSTSESDSPPANRVWFSTRRQQRK